MTRYYIDTTDARDTPPVAARRDLACRRPGVDLEIFYPNKGDSGARAKKVCGICPAQVACLRWALDTDQRFGIWGGTTPDEREKIRNYVGWAA
jgi:WhiB family redox-sensing transcriptional regulator